MVRTLLETPEKQIHGMCTVEILNTCMSNFGAGKDHGAIRNVQDLHRERQSTIE